MIKKVKIIPILSVLIAAFIFVLSITANAVETSSEQAEKPLTFSYWRPLNFQSVNVLLGDDDNIVRKGLGDMDNDGTVTAADARITLRASSRIAALSDEEKIVADVDYDGEVTAADARIILRVSSRLQAYTNPFSIRPATINDFLRAAYRLDLVTSIRIGNPSDKIPDMSELNDASIEYFFGVLKNNADAELYFGQKNDCIIWNPSIWDEIYNADIIKSYPEKRLPLMTDNSFSGTVFNVRKDADGNTWIYETNENFAVKLGNEKDFYDIIVGMANEE